MAYVIEGSGALLNPSEKHQYRNKGDQPFKMICGCPRSLNKFLPHISKMKSYFQDFQEF